MPRIPIAAARVANGWTQAEFAEKIGVSRDLVIHWEKGYTRVKPVYLHAICRVTGFSEDDLILPEGPRKADKGSEA